MRKMKMKLMLAGVLVAGAFGGIGIGVAWATPGAGVTTALLSGPVALDELDIKLESDTHELKLKTKGEWECRNVHFRIVPGGHTGWHSHPGPVFVMITAGKMTISHADDPTTAVVYPAGTGFVDVGHAHIAGNAEAEGDLQFVAFFLTPKGAAIRIDQPAP